MSYSRFGTPATATTRRAMAPLSAFQSGSGSTAFTDILQRLVVTLPVTTTRWRLRIHPGPGTGSITLTDIYVGSLAQSNGIWSGALTGTPALALSVAGSIPNNTEFISAWVTDPTLQFSRAPRAISMGFNCTGSPSLWKGSNGGATWYSTTASSTAVSAQVATLVPTVGTFQSASPFLDVRLEYECVTSYPIILFVGDSTTYGQLGSGANPNVQGAHNSWPQAAGNLYNFIAVNAGVGGANMGSFPSASGTYYTRFSLGVDVFVDAVVFNCGINDAQGGTSTTTFGGNLQTAIAQVAGFGRNGVAPKIFLATIIPTPQWKSGIITTGVASGVTSFSTSVPYANGDSITIGAGTSREETRTVSGASSGSGPYTTTVTVATSSAHDVGETVGLQGHKARLALNTYIRNCPINVHGVVDFATALSFSGDNDRPDLQYFVNDSVHPVASGYARLASFFDIGSAL